METITSTLASLNKPLVFGKKVKLKNIIPEKEFFELDLAEPLRAYYLKKKPTSFLKNLRWTIVSDLKECSDLWEEFSPKESLFDLWSFRMAFYEAYKHKPCFLLLKKGNKNVGLLPLWYEKDKEKYFWFGGYWHEDNKLFVKDSIFAPILLNICPRPVHLNAVSPSAMSDLVINEEFKKFTADDPKYILDLSNIKSFSDYLKKLKKSRRHNLKKDRKKIERQNPEIIIDNFNDLDNLISLSLERFKQKESNGYRDEEEDDLGWKDEKRIQSFRNMIKLSGNTYQARMLTVKINGRVAGVDLIAIYNKCYYALVCGYDVKNFPSIGNYLNILEIEEAINMGMKKIDFLQNNYQWKDRWFQAVPLLEYKVNS